MKTTTGMPKKAAQAAALKAAATSKIIKKANGKATAPFQKPSEKKEPAFSLQAYFIAAVKAGKSLEQVQKVAEKDLKGHTTRDIKKITPAFYKWAHSHK